MQSDRRYTSRLLAVVLVLGTGVVHAHGGGLNREGCHTNRATGEYHCHRGTNAPSQVQPIAPLSSRDASGNRTRAFANCAEARAAGAAPIRRGQPGYGPHLDRDNDGVGCE